MPRISSSVCATAVALLVAGCQPWPPFEFELRENFERNYAAFVTVAEKLEASDYQSLSWPDRFWEEDSEVLFQPATFPETLWATALERQDDAQVVGHTLIETDAGWLPLMKQTGALGVSRGDGGTVSFLLRVAYDDVRTTLIAYQRSRTRGAKLRTCDPAFRDLDCGRCKLGLSGDWYVLYAWRPVDLLEPQHGGDVDQLGIDDDEIWRRLDACYAIGDEAMGYEGDPIRGNGDA